jgi:hypothetical protein
MVNAHGIFMLGEWAGKIILVVSKVTLKRIRAVDVLSDA